MRRLFSFCSPLSRVLRASALLGALGIVATVSLPSASAYSLNGKTWASGEIVLRLGLGNPAVPLLDGNTSWNDAIAPVLEVWNAKMQRVHLSAVLSSPVAATSGDRINSVVFSNSVFGQSFGTGTLAVTYYIMQGSSLVEADVLFNSAQTFNSYRGGLTFGGPGGYALGDIRRVFLHELGHGLGLNHADGDNIMSPTMSNRETLSNDDISGVQAMYGVPIAPPTLPPAITASRLANISTRMRVGIDDNVLIGGFIIRGTDPKRMILRAVGPSLGAYGIAGALSDPSLELFDSTGHSIAQNDNWQSSSQAAEISSSGLAPAHPSESALSATLPPGSYTAVVRGVNGAQGIGLVEGYEQDTNTSRLVNLSTRGRIGTDDQALIGGFIVNGSTNKRVIVRAVGPSAASLIAGTLADPSLEIRNAAGQLIGSNDNWGSSTQVQEIIDTAIPPSHPLESAVVATLPPGSYTAIVRGVNNGTGIGLVEVFDLEP